MYNNSPQNSERKAPEYGFHSPLPTMSQPMLSIPLLPHQNDGSSCSTSGLRGRPYAKKTPSKVWLAYTKSEQGPICNYCGSIRKRKDSSTKTLWDHLDRKHYEVSMVLRRESHLQMHPSTESSINSLIPQAFGSQTNTNDMPYLYLSSFDTSRHDEELMKTDSVLEHSTTSNHYQTFSPMHKDGQEVKCCITEMIENGTEQTVDVNVRPSLVNSQPDKKRAEEPVSLVRWSLVLTALNPSRNSGLFGVSVHGIRIDTGMDFASAEILQVEDGRTVVTSKGTLKLVGPINAESVKKNRLKCFEAGLPLDWRSIIVEQYMNGCTATSPAQ